MPPQSHQRYLCYFAVTAAFLLFSIRFSVNHVRLFISDVTVDTPLSQFALFLAEISLFITVIFKLLLDKNCVMFVLSRYFST